MQLLPKRLLVSAAASSLSALFLIGCGAGVSAGPSINNIAPMTGIVHGGANPVVGATVKLFSTQANQGSGAYMGAGLQIGPSATTGNDGGFSITQTSAGYTCSSNEYLYLTATGGKTGSAATNNNMVLVAALGSCANFATYTAANATTVFINELTTVAAAYALSNFMQVTGSAGSQIVQIGAPANNAAALTTAATSLCTLTSGVTTACTAQGLGHAFQNAYNLVDAVEYSTGTVQPTGMARTTVPGNSSGVVPQALLDSLANALQACVNSGGGKVVTGTGLSDGSNCGNLFLDTTPPGTTTYPTDTLTAAINMAKYPTHNASAIYGLGSPTSFFQPSLSAAPTDLSLAIVYSVPLNNGTTSVASFPVALALDPADNVCLLVADSAPFAANDQIGLYSTDDLLSSNGTLLASVAPVKGVNSAQTSGVYFTHPGLVATDTNGHCWATSFGSPNAEKFFTQLTINGSSSSLAVFPVSATAGTVYGPPQAFSIAIDRSNNLFMGAYLGTGSKYSEVYKSVSPYTAAPTQLTTFGVLQTGGSTPIIGGLAIDNSENIWIAGVSTASATADLFAISKSAPTPTSEVGPSSLDAYGGQPVAIDKNGNGWFPLQSETEEVSVAGAKLAAVGTGSAISTPAAFSNVPAAGAEFDGANLLWFGLNAATAPIQYVSSTAQGQIQPCYPVSGTCADQLSTPNTPYAPTQYTRSMQIDSTGSIWLAAGNGPPAAAGGTSTDVGTQGVVIQVIGTAAPAWPSLAWSTPGVEPQ